MVAEMDFICMQNIEKHGRHHSACYKTRLFIEFCVANPTKFPQITQRNKQADHCEVVCGVLRTRRRLSFEVKPASTLKFLSSREEVQEMDCTRARTWRVEAFLVSEQQSAVYQRFRDILHIFVGFPKMTQFRQMKCVF